jgi:outer membrane protein assembly factor BamB
MWTRQFGSDGSDAVRALGVDSLGDVVVGGDVEMAFASDSLGDGDAFVSKLSGADGTTRWSTQFGGVSYDRVDAIAIDALGDAFVTGSVGIPIPPEDFGQEAHVWKLSGVDGTLLWEAPLGDGVDAGWSAPEVGVTPNGDALTAWNTPWNPLETQHDSGVVRLSGVDGSVVWAILIEGMVETLAVDAVGDIAVIVGVLKGNVYDIRLVKLSGEDGSELWTVDEEPAAIAFDPEGDLFLATPENIRHLSGIDGSVLTTSIPVIREPINAALTVSATGDLALAGTNGALDGFVLKLSGEGWR